MATSALGGIQHYDRFQNFPRSPNDNFKRPPLPFESSSYRIRHAYKSPYLSKDSQSYLSRRSSSCAAENRYNYRNTNDKTTELPGENDYQRSYPISYRSISSAEGRRHENLKTLNHDGRLDFSRVKTEEENFQRISSYDNLFSRINEIEKQVQELRGQELNPTENYRAKYGSYTKRTENNSEIDRLNSLLKHEIDKNQRLAEENERLRKDLLKSEAEVIRLKELNKKTPKKVSFTNSVIEKSSSWRDKMEDPITSRYSQLYETRQKPQNYDFPENKYKNTERVQNSNEDNDYLNYKHYSSYDNYLNKEKYQNDTSSQFSNGTDAILQSADTILKENNDFFAKIKKDYSQSYRTYTESSSSKNSKKRLITPRTISDLKMGDIVKFERQDGKFACGFVRYKGPIDGKNGNFVGLELDHDNGKNDGSLENKRYFYCKQNYGLFIHFDKILVAWTD